jgi:hypothetical protein
MNPNNAFISNKYILIVDKQSMYNPAMMNFNMHVQNPNVNPQMHPPMHADLNQNYNPGMNIPLSEPIKKERLRLKMSQEEK